MPRMSLIKIITLNFPLVNFFEFLKTTKSPRFEKGILFIYFKGLK